MSPAEWLDCCALISQLWPHKPLDPDAAEAWYPLLADLDAAVVHAAVRAVALDPANTWPPSLGQLRAAAEPPPRDWEDALGQLPRLMARRGAHDPRPPDDEIADPALSAVIDAYGWQAVCALEVANPTVRAQFRDAYRAAQARQREQARRHVAAAALDNPHRRALHAG